MGKGIGLGLSICHSIINQHNGRIYAVSELGSRATFVIELPIAANTELMETAGVIGEHPQKQGGAKILLVHGDHAILHFLRSLLIEQGYEVQTADSADAAFHRLHREKYDLILLNIKLPIMSGIELYRHIEATDPTLAQRVVFITGDITEATNRGFLG